MDVSFFGEMAWQSALISGFALALAYVLRSRAAADRALVLRLGVVMLLFVIGLELQVSRLVAMRKDIFQNRIRKMFPSIGEIKQPKLRGGQVIVRRCRRQSVELRFRLLVKRRIFLGHAQQQISEFATQCAVFRIELQRFAELVDEGITLGHLFARQLRRSRLAAP